MATTIQEIDGFMAAAVAALSSGDFKTARVKAICAQGLMATVPESAANNESMKFNPEGIQNFILSVDRAEKASGGSGVGADAGAGASLRRTNLRYV